MPRLLPAALLAANLTWTLALLAAPLSLAPGTVSGLDGHANVVDHRWGHLPAFAGAVYFLGDFNCHQMASRSWSLGGNQLPVDARMTAAFVVGNVGIALVFLAPRLPRVRDEVAAVLPLIVRKHLSNPNRRLAACIAWAAFFAIPLAVDLLLQGAGLYESTNLRRAWTGGLFGFGIGFLVAALFDSLLAAPPPASVEPPPRE